MFLCGSFSPIIFYLLLNILAYPNPNTTSQTVILYIIIICFVSRSCQMILIVLSRAFLLVSESILSKYSSCIDCSLIHLNIPYYLHILFTLEYSWTCLDISISKWMFLYASKYSSSEYFIFIQSLNQNIPRLNILSSSNLSYQNIPRLNILSSSNLSIKIFLVWIFYLHLISLIKIFLVWIF